MPHRSSSRCVLAKQTKLSHSVPCRLYTFSLFDFFQVSLNSDPKVVAGKIAHCSRSDCPPTVLAIGQGCLNQAIKVCVINCAFCCLCLMETPTKLRPSVSAIGCGHCQEVLHAASDTQ